MSNKIFCLRDGEGDKSSNLHLYLSDNDEEYSERIALQIKRLNFFIGRNNSGKSQLLRGLFLLGDDLQVSNYYNLKSLISKIIGEFSQGNDLGTKKNTPNVMRRNGLYILDNKDAKIKKIEESLINLLIEFKYKGDYLSEALSKLHNITADLYFMDTNQQNLSSLDDMGSSIKEKIIKNSNRLPLSEKQFYIPTLRGMRPLSSSIDVFNQRTLQDYFKDKSTINKYMISTGESLYQELKEHLLGNPEHRELVKSYEAKLSEYFFDNEEITLIPKHDEDVVNIKIGDENQFPIYQLGDGLQQAIILTYQAFIEERYNKNSSFFIEEPELNMHPGMVRQLMNFYLNETNHHYFFTTHSNHLLDMIDESDQVMIQKINKIKEGSGNSTFNIMRCNRDRELLSSLGVKPSSVYLSNCTIWVEGITDRLYIIKYMEKYLTELRDSSSCKDKEQYRKYRALMPNYHYTFVEYAGSNLAHWDFSDEFTNQLKNKGLNAYLTASNILLIADGDISKKGSEENNRAIQLEKSMKNKKNFYLLECKEIENTLPSILIILACRILFLGAKNAVSKDEEYKELFEKISIRGMSSNSISGFDIKRLEGNLDFFHKTEGIGKIIDNKIRINKRTKKNCFSESSGTIKEKLKFCNLILQLMDNIEWELTDSGRKVAKKVFEHISMYN